MSRSRTAAVLLLAAATGAASPRTTHESSGDYLAEGEARRSATVTPSGTAADRVIVMTRSVAIKETGPKETVKAFGETYEFSPAFFAVLRDEPTKIEFWNLQGDDAHDVMILDPDLNVLMKQALPPLSKRSWIFMFHKEGIYRFYCTVHLPEMAGQILVIAPRKR